MQYAVGAPLPPPQGQTPGQQGHPGQPEHGATMSWTPHHGRPVPPGSPPSPAAPPAPPAPPAPAAPPVPPP
ncbi:hypothetical protein FCH28_35575, partial [Streptomyces piniterrae]